MTDPAAPPTLMSPPGARVIVDGKKFDYYGGTGYLGLQGHPEVIAAGCRALQTFGVHSATSRSRYESSSVRDAERQATSYFGTERAFYLTSGYVSTGLLLHAVLGSIDAIFIDAASHYSIQEAAAASGVPVVTFANRDPDALQRKISATLTTDQTPLVLTDGVFASFGWIAPVDRYVEILTAYRNPVLLIDDAHGFGVLGDAGRGTLDHFGLWPETNRRGSDGDVRLLVAGTLSKALGSHGGIIPCDVHYHEKITTVAHYYDGASAPAAPVAAAATCALEIVAAEPALREQLQQNITAVRTGLRELGFSIEDLPTPIIGFTHGQASDMRKLHSDLADHGILVPYAAAYSGIGPEGAMRLAVFATHTEEMIQLLLHTIAKLLP